MSGLFSSLSSSVMALNAHSRSIELAGKNLANVSNPDYARQRVIYGDRGTVVTPDGAESLGLEALGIQQLRDTLLDQQVVREAALSAYYQAQQSGYQRAQAGLGQNVASAGETAGVTNSAGDTGIGAALDDFFNAFQSFASNPTDTGVRQALLQTTTVLTDRLQLADKRLGQVQTDLDAQIGADVTETNRLLQSVADLNDQIAQVEINHPGSAVDLRDQRQAALEKLGAKLSFESTEGADGQVQIVARDTASAPVVLVSGSKVSGPITYDTSTTPPTIKGGASATVLRLSSGAIQGSLDAREGAVKTIRTQLNALASQLVSSVNTAYRAGGGTTDFFDATRTTAAGIRLDASVTTTNLRASNSGLAGDNTVALAIARLATQKFSTALATPDQIDGTFTNFYAGAVSGLGQAVAGATARVEDQQRIEQLVRSQRDAVSGVSLDEEMANLMKYQRAFQASSRVFETIDNLLDVVVNQMGNR
jgi:flagellar hook-associated protein 1 FlgK